MSVMSQSLISQNISYNGQPCSLVSAHRQWQITIGDIDAMDLTMVHVHGLSADVNPHAELVAI